MPRLAASWMRASSRPWVTQTSGAATSTNRGEEFVPVAVVADDKGEFDAFAFGALADAHPTAGHADDGFVEAAGPSVGDGAGGGDDDGAGEGGLVGDGGGEKRAEGDAEAFIGGAEGGHGAVEVDGRVPAGLAQEGDHALRLAEGVGADDVGAVGEEGDAVERVSGLRRRPGGGGRPGGRRWPR